ncbi:hypothetical protein EDD86DRAFT_209101 [Gorgonomyces haynaldii]|nr:hypothetical protein EDD86DRAFT_209101 [Gorgonomyces haynaldii]
MLLFLFGTFAALIHICPDDAHNSPIFRMSTPDSRAWIYASAVLHGVAYHEWFSCLTMLLSKLTLDRNQIKRPVFLLSCVVMLTSILQLASLSNILDWFASPFPINGDVTLPVASSWYSNVSSFSYSITMISDILIILLLCVRLHGVFGWESSVFRAFVGVSAIGIVLHVVNLVIGVMVYSTGFLFASHSLFRSFTSIHCAVYFIDAALNFVGSLTFLWKLSEVLGLKSIKLGLEIIGNHDGPRYLIVIALNIFVIICVAYNAARLVQSDVSATAYHAGPWQVLVEMYVFLESSFALSSSSLHNSQSSGKKGLNETATGGSAKQATSHN